MGRRKLWLKLIAWWGALSGVLWWLVKETVSTALFDEGAALVERATGRKLPEMIENALPYAIPALGSAAVVAGIYWTAFRHGTARAHALARPSSAAVPTIDEKPPSAPPQSITDWLPLEDALRTFIDPTVAKRYETAQSEVWRIMFERDEKGQHRPKEEVDAATEDLRSASLNAEIDLVDRLRTGALIAKGTVAPLTADSRETVVPAGWWTFLELNLNEAVASGHGVKLVGLMVSRAKI